MSCISHINYTATVGSAPINVKNANGWLGKQGKCRGGIFLFIFSLSLNPKSEDPPSSHLTWQWRISSLWGERDSLTWGRSRVLCGEKGEQIFTRLRCHFCTHLFRHQRIGGVVITASVKWTLIWINWWSNAGTCLQELYCFLCFNEKVQHAFLKTNHIFFYLSVFHWLSICLSTGLLFFFFLALRTISLADLFMWNVILGHGHDINIHY